MNGNYQLHPNAIIQPIVIGSGNTGGGKNSQQQQQQQQQQQVIKDISYNNNNNNYNDNNNSNKCGGIFRNINTNNNTTGCCSRCFGDVRQAVIAVNVINITLLLMSIVSLYLLKHVYNDDGSYRNNSYYYTNSGLLRSITMMRMIISCMGIIGAIYYKPYMIGFCAMMYVLDSIMAILGLNLIPFIFAVLFAYPHFLLMKEIHENGIEHDAFIIDMNHHNHPKSTNHGEHCCV